MAFCGHCGKEIADGEVCSCMAENQNGAQTGDMGAAVENQNTAPVDNVVEKVKKMGGNNKFIIPVVAVVAVIVVVILGSLLFGGGGYKAPIDDFVSLVNKKCLDSAKYENVLRPDFAVKCYNDVEKYMMKSDDYADEQEDNKDRMEEYFEDMDDELGKWKLSFEMKSKEKIDKDDIEDLQENLEDSFDYMEDSIEDFEDMLDDEDDIEDYADALDIDEKDVKGLAKALINTYKQYEKAKITAGYEVKGKFIIKTKDDEFKTDTVKIRVLKVNGDWCYAGTVGDSVYFDMDDEDVYVGFIQSYLNTSYVSN